MRISKITGMVVRIRLRKEFKHASYRRNWSDNFIVRCELEDGTIGWGEGVPRLYVTGESPEGALQQLATTNLKQKLSAACENWADVISMCEAYQPDGMPSDPRDCLANAHRCAVELSILDAFGKLFEQPLHRVVELIPEAAGIQSHQARVQYSTAITSGRIKKEILSSLAMRIYGFNHCKVKVGMNPEMDAERLRSIRRWIGSRMDLRVDANEAWSKEEVVRRITDLQPYKISCVEQPVAHTDIQQLAQVRKQVETFIMLDESLTSMPDARRAIDEGLCDVFNIRISKCGGFLRSVRLAALAHRAGLEYQLGCHPGETAILSAAGRHFASSIGGIRYREGSADRHLLKDHIAQRPLTFGYGGWANAIHSAGLGIHVDEQKLTPCIENSQTFSVT
jgi:L-Ala-D/L-Glu epimerase